MEYIREGSSLPVPFNIIPTPHSLFRLGKLVFEMILKRKMRKESPEEIEANNIPNGNLPNVIFFLKR